MALDILAEKNPFLMTTIRDFDTKCKNWHSQDKTSFEGKTIESVTLQFELYQLINEPTHLWGDTHMMSTLRGKGGGGW